MKSFKNVQNVVLIMLNQDREISILGLFEQQHILDSRRLHNDHRNYHPMKQIINSNLFYYRIV
jgi:hypothetical protein